MTRYAVRPAVEDDAEVLFAWRNDSQSLRWSRSQEPVVWPEHLRWLRAVLTAEDRLLRVLDTDGRQVASVRYDRDPDKPTRVEVNIVVAGAARGQGVGAVTLRLGEEVLMDSWPEVRTIRAVVHRDNTASRRLFLGAGYQLQVEVDPWVTLVKGVGDARSVPTLPPGEHQRSQR